MDRKKRGSVNQGYFPVKETSDIHPDLVEGWVFCRRAFDLDPAARFAPERFWPRPEMASLPGPKYPPVKAIAFHTRTTSKFYGDGYAVDD